MVSSMLSALSALVVEADLDVVAGGIDFYYGHKQDAWKMVDFLQAVLPIRYQHAQELVTHDPHNNTYDYKHSYSVEIVPICKVREVRFW